LTCSFSGELEKRKRGEEGGGGGVEGQSSTGEGGGGRGGGATAEGQGEEGVEGVDAEQFVVVRRVLICDTRSTRHASRITGKLG